MSLALQNQTVFQMAFCTSLWQLLCSHGNMHTDLSVSLYSLTASDFALQKARTNCKHYTGFVLAWIRKKLQGNIGVDCKEGYAARLAVNLA